MYQGVVLERDKANDEIKRLREALERVETELNVKEIILMSDEEFMAAFDKSCKEQGKDAKEEIKKLKDIFHAVALEVKGE